jgi:hypothetical protein
MCRGHSSSATSTRVHSRREWSAHIGA